MAQERLAIFSGHYGSGKTSIAVSLAMDKQAEEFSVAIGDMDIVNPYFRTADSREALESRGIQLVCSPFAGSNLDVPSLPRELYSIIADKSKYTVLDVGGDDAGAIALGRYSSLIMENAYEMYMVVNFHRPLSGTPQEVMEIMAQIENAASLKCTGLVNNSNIGAYTEAEDVLCTLERMEKLSELSGLPIKMTTAVPRLKADLEGKVPSLYIINAQSFGIG